MALYLGKIGRQILNYTVAHLRLNRAVNAFGKVAHKATFGRYTPGLTRESFLLLQKTLPGDKIEVKKDGFYGTGEKIAGNVSISKRIKENGLPLGFLRTNEDTPESIAEYCRLNFRSYTYFKLFKLTTAAMALFSLPDIIFRFVVNATIPAWSTKLTCEGFNRALNKMIRWQSFSTERGTPSLDECWDILPNSINRNGIEYVANFHYDNIGERTQDFLTNHHHYDVSLSSLNSIVLLFGLPMMLLLFSFFAYKVNTNKYLRNLVITTGALFAANGFVNRGEILWNGYATNYLNPAGNPFNLADCYAVIGILGLNMISALIIYKGIKKQGALLS